MMALVSIEWILEQAGPHQRQDPLRCGHQPYPKNKTQGIVYWFQMLIFMLFKT